MRSELELKKEIEAILLLGGDEIKIREISKFFNLSLEKTLSILEKLKFERKETGINIEIYEDSVYLVTNPQCGESVNKFFQQEAKPKKLSSAALETLSIIAYNQPVTKSEIESIRGVSADRLLIVLEEKRFVEIVGKKESVGRPNLYGVTSKFLSYLGITALEELPNYNEIKEKRDGRN
jgi:segregation and condensation protein B